MQRNSQPIRIVIVEDHPTMLWGLERLINSERPRMEVVGTAGSFDAALEQVGRHKPDLLLLDLDLGGRNAIELLPAVLSGTSMRALVLTGEHRENVLDLAVRQGARGIVSKDAPADRLLKAIEKTSEGELWLDRGTLGRVFGDLMDPGRLARLDEHASKQASLTAREREIVQAVVEMPGGLNKEVAGRLFISEHTLRNHLTSIYQKLDVTTRLELYIYATQHMAAPADGGHH